MKVAAVKCPENSSLATIPELREKADVYRPTRTSREIVDDRFPMIKSSQIVNHNVNGYDSGDNVT